MLRTLCALVFWIGLAIYAPAVAITLALGLVVWLIVISVAYR